MIRTIILIFIIAIAATGASGQEKEDTARTYFDNISLDPDGHICYVESIDGTASNRIEYREDGRATVSLYLTEGQLTKYVEITDFNGDKKPDIITVAWTRGGTEISRLMLYRGAEFREHRKRHLLHALHTASHPLIVGRADEQARAKEIQALLDGLDRTSVGEDEMGIYTPEQAFQKEDHRNILYAFSASNNLIAALSNIITGDYRRLSQRPELTKEYKIDIGILLSIDPAALHPK